MATYTTNLSLIKPAGTDKIRIAQINQNMDTIDAAIGAVGNTSLQTQVTGISDSMSAVEGGIAIVSNNNTHVAITSGQYVYVKNHATLSEGLYRATQAIATNGTLTLSNVTPESAGGLNSLNEQIGKKGKIYRVLITNGETTAGDYFPLSGEYLANAFVQVSNTNEIHFSENATVLILVHLVGKTDNSGRGWISLIGGNYNADSIAYGNYVTLDIPLVTSVSSSTIIKLKSNDATINVGGGGIIGSRILIIRIE